MKPFIVYIGSFSFPLGDAVAKRALGIGKSLSKAGYSVAFIGEDKNVPLGEISDISCYEEFKFCNVHKSNSSIEHYRYRKDIKVVKDRLEKWNKEYKITTVIFCGTKCSFFADKIVSICKKMNIPTIADSMDWLQTHTGNIIFDVIKQTDITYEVCRVNRKSQAVIAISDFLANYYKNKGMKTIIIPPISPYERQCQEVEKNSKLTLVYAGIPCRLGKPLKNKEDAKDRLDLAMFLLYYAHQIKCEFVFLIYGLTKEQYCTVFPKQKPIIEEMIRAEKVEFKGYAQEKVVREAVRKADYTVLLRDKNRTSMAGFPTKISESIVLGTPVITTDTSDISKYIREGIDGYFLDIADIEKAKSKLVEVLQQGKDQSFKMKEETKTNNSFLATTYSSKLDEFIKEITEKNNY